MKYKVLSVDPYNIISPRSETTPRTQSQPTAAESSSRRNKQVVFAEASSRGTAATGHPVTHSSHTHPSSHPLQQEGQNNGSSSRSNSRGKTRSRSPSQQLHLYKWQVDGPLSIPLPSSRLHSRDNSRNNSRNNSRANSPDRGPLGSKGSSRSNSPNRLLPGSIDMSKLLSAALTATKGSNKGGSSRGSSPNRGLPGSLEHNRSSRNNSPNRCLPGSLDINRLVSAATASKGSSSSSSRSRSPNRGLSGPIVPNTSISEAAGRSNRRTDSPDMCRAGNHSSSNRKGNGLDTSTGPVQGQPKDGGSGSSARAALQPAVKSCSMGSPAPEYAAAATANMEISNNRRRLPVPLIALGRPTDAGDSYTAVDAKKSPKRSSSDSSAVAEPGVPLLAGAAVSAAEAAASRLLGGAGTAAASEYRNSSHSRLLKLVGQVDVSAAAAAAAAAVAAASSSQPTAADADAAAEGSRRDARSAAGLQVAPAITVDNEGISSSSGSCSKVRSISPERCLRSYAVGAECVTVSGAPVNSSSGSSRRRSKSCGRSDSRTAKQLPDTQEAPYDSSGSGSSRSRSCGRGCGKWAAQLPLIEEVPVDQAHFKWLKVQLAKTSIAADAGVAKADALQQQNEQLQEVRERLLQQHKAVQQDNRKLMNRVQELQAKVEELQDADKKADAWETGVERLLLRLQQQQQQQESQECTLHREELQFAQQCIEQQGQLLREAREQARETQIELDASAAAARVAWEMYEGLIQQLVPLLSKAAGAVDLLNRSDINWLDGTGSSKQYKAGVLQGAKVLAALAQLPHVVKQQLDTRSHTAADSAIPHAVAGAYAAAEAAASAAAGMIAIESMRAATTAARRGNSPKPSHPRQQQQQQQQQQLPKEGSSHFTIPAGLTAVSVAGEDSPLSRLRSPRSKQQLKTL